MPLRYNFGGIDGAASASTAAELNVFASTGDDGSKGGNVEFEWKVEEGESSGEVFGFTTTDASKVASMGIEYKLERCLVTSWSTSGDADDTFDFKAMEVSEAAGTQLGTIKTFICPADVVSLNGDGIDDLATYQQIDPASDGTSLPNFRVIDLQLNSTFDIMV